MFFLQGAKGFYDLLLISALFFCFFIRRSKTADLVQNLIYIILVCFCFAETAGAMPAVVSDGKTAGLGASWALPGPPSKSFPFSATSSVEVGWAH